MKKFFLLPLMAMVFVSMAMKTDELTIGSKAPSPERKLKDYNGKSYSFNDVKKKNGLLVVFSCNTCPWVIKNQQVAAAAYNYALSKEVGVMVLNSNEAEREDADSKTAMMQYAKDQGYKWPYVLDDNSTMANAFGAKVTPECYLFNKDLKLVYHGAITDNPKTPSESTRDHLKVAIDELVEGKPVSMATSKAMGCGIKRKS
ncbi:MAG: redoxin family protein [Chitinophagaceae bacterium]|nr:redoxin family protein [Chitinophagaceae bacterium]